MSELSLWRMGAGVEIFIGLIILWISMRMASIESEGWPLYMVIAVALILLAVAFIVASYTSLFEAPEKDWVEEDGF